MTDNAFKARDIGLRAQKKILSRMATKNIAKQFIDGTTASLLDNVYRLAKIHVSTHLIDIKSNLTSSIVKQSICFRFVTKIFRKNIECKEKFGWEIFGVDHF